MWFSHLKGTRILVPTTDMLCRPQSGVCGYLWRYITGVLRYITEVGKSKKVHREVYTSKKWEYTQSVHWLYAEVGSGGLGSGL